MKPLLALCLCFFVDLVHADLSHAPASFMTSEGRAIFTDFQSAEYDITYDSATKKVQAITKITFNTLEEGMPIFDMLESPISVMVDGEKTTSKTIKSADKETTYNLALKNLFPGRHVLEITSHIKENVSFTTEGVSSAFWFSDLDDRSYLEVYLPTNLEYDQYQMTFNLDFKNLLKQKVYSNGEIIKLSESAFTVTFPETYTASSLYFHTAPEGRYPEKIFTFKSIDGRDLPITAYAAGSSSNMENIKKSIVTSLQGLESTYGPFLHDKLTVFIAGSGGMEYCGATMTSLWALNHELTHSYFARGGFMPANGNSGWIDEAITSWSDEGKTSKADISDVYSNMAGNSPYRRYTHGDAYTYGKSFMAHLNYKFKAEGGLTTFLNHLIETDAFKPMTTEEFIVKISSFYNEDLNPLFKKHTYKRNPDINSGRKPAHMKHTIKEMKEFL